MLIKEGSNMLVQQITVDEFKKKLDNIFQSNTFPSKFCPVQDNLKEIIVNELNREYEERMQSCKQKIC